MIRLSTRALSYFGVFSVVCSWPALAISADDIQFFVKHQKETDPAIIASFKMDEGPVLPPITPDPIPGGGGGGNPGTGTPGGDWTIPPYYPPYTGGTGSGFRLDTIINLAREVWQIIQQGKPSATVTSMNANALPEGARSAHDLVGWVKTPKVYLYTIDFKSFGKQVGHFKYRVAYTYGGGVEGRGRYLTSVKVVPADYKVPWGNSMDAKSEVSNTYSIDRRDDPTAVMEFMITWTLSSNFRFIGGSRSFIVRGDGSFQDISDGTKRSMIK